MVDRYKHMSQADWQHRWGLQRGCILVCRLGGGCAVQPHRWTRQLHGSSGCIASRDGSFLLLPCADTPTCSSEPLMWQGSLRRWSCLWAVPPRQQQQPHEWQPRPGKAAGQPRRPSRQRSSTWSWQRWEGVLQRQSCLSLQAVAASCLGYSCALPRINGSSEERARLSCSLSTAICRGSAPPAAAGGPSPDASTPLWGD